MHPTYKYRKGLRTKYGSEEIDPESLSTTPRRVKEVLSYKPYRSLTEKIKQATLDKIMGSMIKRADIKSILKTGKLLRK